MWFCDQLFDGFRISVTFQMNDSSIIISALESHLHDTKMDLKTLLTYYPMMEMMDQRSGKMKMECPNRHAIMYGQSMGKDVSMECYLDTDACVIN